MRVRPAVVLALILIVTLCIPILVQAQEAEDGDGIPANCEWGDAAARDVFARYEPQNARLALVSWSSGAIVRVLGENLPDTRVLGWSGSCRYLAGAVGSADSMDTVVWDTATGAEIGRVADAHGQPHAITWGPADFLMVETRNGAVLWNVPANTQTVLTTAFDPNRVRNFTRLRWDADALQVTANQVDGQRVVYDLATGQAIPVAASAIESQALEPDEPRLIIGGHSYDCDGYAIRGYEATYRFRTYFDRTNGVLRLNDYLPGGREESIAVIEEGLQADWFQERGRMGCRYLIGILGRVGEDVSDTVVWDLTTMQRVGTFPDARGVPYPLTLGENSLIVETRNGGYLWYLPTDTKILLITDVAYGTTIYQRAATNFRYIYWDRALQLFIGKPIGSSDFDPYTLGYNGTTGEFVPVNFLYPSYAPYSNEPNERPIQPLLAVNPVTGESGYGTLWSNPTQIYTAFYRQRQSTNAFYDSLAIEETLDRELFIVRSSTNEVLARFDHPYRFDDYPRVIWSPDGEWAWVQTTVGAFVWNEIQGATLIYSDDPSGTSTFRDGAIRNYAFVYWDLERGQIIIPTWRGASSFDLRTGQRRYEFYARPDPVGGYEIDRPIIEINGNMLTVTDFLPPSNPYEQYGSTYFSPTRYRGIWNLDTMEVTYSTFPPVEDDTGE